MQSSNHPTHPTKHHYVRIVWLPCLAGAQVKFGHVPAVSAPSRRQTDRRSHPRRGQSPACLRRPGVRSAVSIGAGRSRCGSADGPTGTTPGGGTIWQLSAHT
jgi:hypothetical protein